MKQKKNEGKEFLLQWKHYLLIKLNPMVQVYEDHWIERDIEKWDSMISCVDAPFKTLGLKICLKGDLPFYYGTLPLGIR